MVVSILPSYARRQPHSCPVVQQGMASSSSIEFYSFDVEVAVWLPAIRKLNTLILSTINRYLTSEDALLITGVLLGNMVASNLTSTPVVTTMIKEATQTVVYTFNLQPISRTGWAVCSVLFVCELLL